MSSLSSVPRVEHNVLKDFWNDELDKLKQQSIDWHKLWADWGRPRSGVVNSIRLNVEYKYKVAIQEGASEFELKHSDELYEFWLNKDSTNVWKSWNSKYKNDFLMMCVLMVVLVVLLLLNHFVFI